MSSECTICPPWAVRCAHFGGRLLTLSDIRIYGTSRAECSHADHSSKHYSVAFVGEQMCACGVRALAGPGKILLTNDRAAAEAEFARCEAHLLGREDAADCGGY